MPLSTTAKSRLKKAGRIILRTFLIIFGVIVLLLVLLQTPPVQNFLRGKAVTFLQKKLNTKVAIGKIYIGFPKNIVIENIYVEDRSKDTLLYGGQLRANINLLQLLKSELIINSVSLKNTHAEIKRSLPDTTFNFQFIVDAFAPKTPSAKPKDTSAMKIDIDDVTLDKVSLQYKDVVTGNDMTVAIGHFDTHINKFDLQHMAFEVPRTTLSGLRANIHQFKPIATPEPFAADSAEAKAPPALQLNFEEIALEDCQLDYNNDVSAFYTHFKTEELNIDARQFDLPKRTVSLNNLLIAGTEIAIRLGKKEQAKIIAKEVEQEAKAQAQNNWTVSVDDLELDNNQFRLENDNAPRTARGIDYAHLDISHLSLAAEKVHYSIDSISGSITSGSLKEKKGFELKQLRTDFLYAAKEAYTHNLLLETSGTRIERDLAIRYPSIEALSKDITQLYISADLRNTRIQVKDILTFVPALASQPAFSNPNVTWLLNSKVQGTVNNLRLQTLQLQAWQTRVDVSGTITGLPDVKQFYANLAIRTLSSTAADVKRLLPPNTLPPSIELPARFGVSGRFAGGMRNIQTDLRIATTLGDATIKGTAQNLTDSNNIQYDLAVTTHSLNLQRLLKQKALGPITLSASAKGRGRNPQTMNAALNGTIQSFVYNQYNYRNFNFKGTIARRQLDFSASIKNEPIHVSLKASGNFFDEAPSIKFTAMVDSLKTQPLHLSKDPIILRGNITGDFPVTDPDNLQGKLMATHFLVVKNQERFQLDTVQLLAANTDSGRLLQVRSQLMNAQVLGRYRLTKLGNIFQQAVQRYFSPAQDTAAVATVNNTTARTPKTTDSTLRKKDTAEDYDFRITAVFTNKPPVKIFLPDLQQMETATLTSHFSRTEGMNVLVDVPLLIYGPNRVEAFTLRANSQSDRLLVNAFVKRVNSGTSIALFNTGIYGTLANNQIDFALNTTDINGRNKYHLGANVSQPQTGTYQLSLKSDSLLLNYQAWQISSGNSLRFSPDSLTANNFVLSRNGEQLALQTLSETGVPLEAKFTTFHLATLVALVQPDSLLVDGELSGNILLHDLTKKLTFTSDLTINNFTVKKDTLGTIRAMVKNTSGSDYNALVTLTGLGNDLQLKGDYYVRPDSNSRAAIDLDIRALQLSTLEGVSMGNIRNASGTISGHFDLDGSIDKPQVRGELNFNNAGFTPTLIGSRVTINDEKIRVTNEGLFFDTFTMVDSSNNKAVLDGAIYLTDMSNYRFALSFNAQDFQALNTTKRDNKIYYGRLFFNTRLNIKGTDKQPVIDGSLKINERTKLTVVLPQKDPGVVDREGIVTFVDRDAPLNDSLFLSSYDSMNTSVLRDYDISLNITIDKEAELNLVVDEGNGDFLRVKGEASLTGGIDPSGKVTLTGLYEMQQGSYELTFNFIHRKFDIQPGSRITWQGEPTKADVDVSAVYIAKTAPLDLVENQLTSESATERNTYRQRVPFEVYLNMKGELLSPIITFDIKLPEDKNYDVDKAIINTVNVRLDQLRQEPSELNKQVFALLLLNRFVSDNPFESSNGLTAESFARQSASKLLTDQLNQLAGNLIEGVDINFDLQSTEDYTTGSMQNRTDLNVALSKQLLNDRLRVTVGSNFEVEGASGANRNANNLAGNIALDYKLSKDGRYLLRAYRKNEYEGVLEGYIIETGVGFVISLDYNRFRDIFLSQKARQQRRQQRLQRRKQEQEQKPAEPATTTTDNTTQPAKIN